MKHNVTTRTSSTNKKESRRLTAMLTAIALAATSITTFAATSTTTVAATPSATILLGDIDGDGSVTLADAQTALKIALRINIATPEQERLADIDGDSSVTLADAQASLKTALRIESERYITVEPSEAPVVTDDAVSVTTAPAVTTKPSVAPSVAPKTEEPTVAPTATPIEESFIPVKPIITEEPTKTPVATPTVTPFVPVIPVVPVTSEAPSATPKPSVAPVATKTPTVAPTTTPVATKAPTETPYACPDCGGTVWRAVGCDVYNLTVTTTQVPHETKIPLYTQQPVRTLVRDYETHKVNLTYGENGIGVDWTVEYNKFVAEHCGEYGSFQDSNGKWFVLIPLYLQPFSQYNYVTYDYELYKDKDGNIVASDSLLEYLEENNVDTLTYEEWAHAKRVSSDGFENLATSTKASNGMGGEAVWGSKDYEIEVGSHYEITGYKTVCTGYDVQTTYETVTKEKLTQSGYRYIDGCKCCGVNCDHITYEHVDTINSVAGNNKVLLGFRDEVVNRTDVEWHYDTVNEKDVLIWKEWTEVTQ